MDQLERLGELRDKGLLTEEEFEFERKKIIPFIDTSETEDFSDVDLVVDDISDDFSDVDLVVDDISDVDLVVDDFPDDFSDVDLVVDDIPDESKPFSSWDTNPFLDSTSDDQIEVTKWSDLTEQEKLEKRDGCVKAFLIVVLGFVLLGAIISSVEGDSSGIKTPFDNYQSFPI